MEKQTADNGPGIGKGTPGPGRPKGVPNKATAELKALAQVHAPMAIEKLVQLIQHAESEAAQVAAIRELLDRGFGKPSQALTGEDGKPLFPEEVIWRRAANRG